MKLKNLILLLISTSLLGGCHFYKIGQARQVDEKVIQKQVDIGDYLIVHIENEEKYYHFQLESYSSTELKGKLTDVSYEHDAYSIGRNKPQKKVWRYRKPENYPINETHIFLSEIIKLENELVVLPIEKITKMEVYDEATGLTVASYIGIPAVTIGAAGFIFLLIACACPQVYIADNNQFIHQGGIFPGAISQKMERYDHRILPLDFGDDQSYILKIRNENPEIDYLDFLELQWVEHDLSQRLYKDKNGKLISVENLVYPATVILNEETIPSHLPSPLSMLGTSDENGMNSIIMELPDNLNEQEFSLIIEGRNTEWMDYTFREFFSLFGESYESFKERQQNQPVESRLEWLRNQGVLLNVYLDNGSGWEYFDFFNIAGSGNSRTMAMIINKKGMSSKTRIKLESGFNFWEISSIQLAQISNSNPEIQTLSLKHVENTEGQKISPNLIIEDTKYDLVLLSGEEATFYFEKPLNQSNGTLFLNARGYYEYNFKFSGKAKTAQLKKFKKEGYFSRFSMENYLQQTLIANDKSGRNDFHYTGAR